MSAGPVSTSYFSTPSDELDPRLFAGHHLRPWARSGVLELLHQHLAKSYVAPERWAQAWLAGSGVSFQWSAVRFPGDLDCLIGVNYPTFRACNMEYVGLSDVEISAMLNEGFNAGLMPNTTNWHGYELTFYVNPGATDIRSINPYAAYDVTSDEWTVEPQRTAPLYSRAWKVQADRDHDVTKGIVARYSQALTDVKGAVNPAHRVNAETRLKLSLDQATDLFDDIHHGRKIAFSPVGAGYADYHNYRWQAAKASGVVGALKQIRDYRNETLLERQVQTYGVELPDTDTLIRRAATYRS